MADISKEIQAFRDAVKGEEVRGSMISLTEKVNHETENNTGVANTAAANANKAAGAANTAAGRANTSADIANTATANANAAAKNASDTRRDIIDRLAAGEFKGDPGDKGEPGAQGDTGASGISISTTSPLFTVYVDHADNGALHVVYDDAAGEAPPIKYRESDGAIYWQYEDGT